MDHAATMGSTYERINGGDIAGFGDLVADDFTEHQGGPGLPPTKEGTLEFFRILLAAFPDMRMTVDDLDALKGVLSSVPPEMAAQAESHGVIMPMTVYVEA